MRKRKRNKRKSYATGITIYIVICIIALSLSIPAFDLLIRKHDLTISNDICGLIAEKMSNSMSYLTDSAKGRAEVLSSAEISDWSELYHLLVENNTADEYDSIGLIDSQNNVYGRANEAEELAKWELVQQAEKSEEVFISEPYRQSFSGQMVFTIFAPIYQSKEKVGSLYLTYKLEEIQKMADSSMLDEHTEIFLMNPYSNNYILCFGADKNQIGSWSNTKLLYGEILPQGELDFADWEAAMRRGEDGTAVFYKLDGVLYTQVFVNVDVMNNWSVAVRIPSNALSYNLKVFHMSVILMVAFVIVALLVLLMIAFKNMSQESKMLSHLSTHDPLTGLLNRRAFEQLYVETSEEATDTNRALIFFDIDLFKQINDGCGHAIGDRVLQDFAKYASKIFESNGTVSRFGGDEFVVLIQSCEDRAVVSRQLDELLEKIRSIDYAIKENGTLCPVHFSAGAVLIADANVTLEQAEKKADIALYQIKKNGRNNYMWLEQ